MPWGPIRLGAWTIQLCTSCGVDAAVRAGAAAKRPASSNATLRADARHSQEASVRAFVGKIIYS